MALTAEWQHRISRWERVLWDLCYQPLGTVQLNAFTTRQQLSPQLALQGDFQPMPSGTFWGDLWEYAWFQGAFSLPEAAGGQRIVLRLDPGAEALVWVNGQIAGSRDRFHTELTLARQAVPGASYHVLLEAYAGHGPQEEGKGPVPPGQERLPVPGKPQTVVGESTYGVWREEIYQLALDFTTLYMLRENLDPLSLRVSQIDQGLMDASLLFDPELVGNTLLESARTARQRLQPLLECRNGSTATTLYAFGHAHLDIAWLWPLAETDRKIARTAANTLALIEEYPEYRYLQSQPHLYTMLHDRYPELYKRFSAAVKSGHVIPDGAMWVEADTNLTSGESLVRQLLHGRRFFRQEFDVESRVVWLPDVFGYSGALPQILRGFDCAGFATAKITWAYGGGDPFPYNNFLWEGIDGTTIPAHIFTEYNSQTHPADLLKRWNTRLQKNDITSMLLAYGWGDGGGGPTRDHLEFLRRQSDLEGAPRVRHASPAEFFANLLAHNPPRQRYVGELYFQAHRGTYTSQARTKAANRRAELALREAELWGCAAQALTGYSFDSQTLETAWCSLLLHQFHDILPGSSIQRVYQEAETVLAGVISSADQVSCRAAAVHLEEARDSFVVFNSLSWARKDLLELPNGDLREIELPPCGWTTIYDQGIQQQGRGDQAIKGEAVTASYREGVFDLENSHLRAGFDARGELVSLFDKDRNMEVMAGPGNRFCLYKDVPANWDAWDIDSNAELQPLSLDEPVEIEITSSGPLSAELHLRRKLHQSSLEQRIRLRRDSRRLDFITTVDWRERHKLLKVCFPVNVHANEAIHEIQFGHLRRPTHRSRQFDADRFEVCQHKWSALAEEGRGVALLNDCKYGISVLGNCLNLTLLKAALAPDPSADLGRQSFVYALYPWNGSLLESGVVQQAYELNCPPWVLPGKAGKRSLFNLDAPTVILETVKPAEDGSMDIILRLYEAMRCATHCSLTTSLPIQSAFQTNLEENNPAELTIQDGCIGLDFRPFEIKTLRLKL